MLMNAEEIVLVSDLTLAGIRDTLRIKSSLNSLGCNARLTIVASRTNTAGVGHVDKATFEKSVQAKIDALIVEDAAALTAASNSGKALGEAAPKAPLTKALRDLAVRLGNIEEAAIVKQSFWDKMFGSPADKKKSGKRSTT